MWFDSWSDIQRILLVGAAAYGILVVVLRLSGKRTLAKLNAFDFVVTVALGSTLATILLNSAVSWTEGAVAFGLLAALQYLAATLGSRFRPVRDLMTSEPVYLVRDGRLLEPALRKHRVAMAEVRQSLRNTGVGDFQRVAAVVLETDGTISVVTEDKRGDSWALEDVRGG